MKTFTLILKGILLYTTTIITMIFVMAVDSIYDNGYFLITLGIVIGLIFLCTKVININELDKLLFERKCTHTNK